MPDVQIISAVPTAFDDDGNIDIDSSARVVSHCLGAGVDAIFVNGTTGEFASLSRDERKQLLAAAIDVAGPGRVIAHVGAPSPHQVKLLTEDALSLGITRLSVLTPFYMPSSLNGIREQLAAVKSLSATAQVYLYLFPDRTGVQIAPAHAAQLIGEFELAGAKLSIPGTGYLSDVVAELPAPSEVLSGNDGLMREVVAAGGAGVVSGVSSSLPGIFVELATAIRGGDPRRTDEIATIVNRVVPVLGPSISGLKLALLKQGLIRSTRCRMAIDAPDATHERQITEVLAATQPDAVSMSS